MSKSKININKVLEEIDRTFNIMEELENQDIEKLDLDNISKKINNIKKKLKNLDTKE